MRPGGTLVVDEFDVERFDERAAAWWLEQRAAAGEVQEIGSAALVERHRGHLHPLTRIRRELLPFFALDEPARGAYLHRWHLPPEALDVEHRLIAEGRLPATGARFAGTRRAGGRDRR